MRCMCNELFELPTKKKKTNKNREKSEVKNQCEHAL